MAGSLRAPSSNVCSVTAAWCQHQVINAHSEHDSELIPSYILGGLILDVRPYRPSDVLSSVHACAERFAKHTKEQGHRPMFVTVPKRISYRRLDQQIVVTHPFLTMVATLPLLNGHPLAPRTLTPDRFLRLLRMATELYDPVDKGHPDRMIFREIAKQAPYHARCCSTAMPPHVSGTQRSTSMPSSRPTPVSM